MSRAATGCSWAKRRVSSPCSCRGDDFGELARPVLRTTGPYRLVRHPMYVGMLLAAAGFAVLRARLVSIVALAGMIIVLSSKATVEERELLTLFPGRYRDYLRDTSRALPTTPWMSPEHT